MQPSEFAQDRPGAGRGHVLRREPARRRAWRDLARPAPSSSACSGLLIAQAAGSRAPRSRSCRFSSASPSWPACGCSILRHPRRSPALLTAPVAWTFALKDYQKSRIQTFLDPEQDARGAGYQQIQARITVGSGGLTGKGYLQGTRRANTSSCPSRTTTSSTRCWPRSSDSSACVVTLGALSVRDHPLARGGAARHRSPRGLPRRRTDLGVHLPGDLQHHDVGGSRAREGADTAAHELWRLVRSSRRWPVSASS